jgi:hypothetical protein
MIDALMQDEHARKEMLSHLLKYYKRRQASGLHEQLEGGRMKKR